MARGNVSCLGVTWIIMESRETHDFNALLSAWKD